MPIDDAGYKCPFPFTRRFKVADLLRPVRLSAADRKLLDEKPQRNNSATQ
jgi:hypothetical protein